MRLVKVKHDLGPSSWNVADHSFSISVVQQITLYLLYSLPSIRKTNEKKAFQIRKAFFENTMDSRDDMGR